MTLAVVGTVVGIVVGIVGMWAKARPHAKRAEAGWDAILGKEPVKDRSGEIMEAAQPGLVHRTSVLEETVGKVVDLLAEQADDRQRLASVEREQMMHGVRITSLERNEAERVAIREESAAFMRLAAERDTITGQVDE